MSSVTEFPYRSGTSRPMRKNDRSRQVSWLAGYRCGPPSPDDRVANWPYLSADSCGSSCRFGAFADMRRTTFPFTPCYGAPCPRKICSVILPLVQQTCAGRVRRANKSGTPKNAVTTPNFNSLRVGMMRIKLSASTNNIAPKSAAGKSVFDGKAPVSGRTKCGASRPTKPITRSPKPPPRRPAPAH